MPKYKPLPRKQRVLNRGYLYSRKDEDIKNVIKVLKSDYLTQGNNVPLLEKEISKKVKAKYCIGVNSATSALHLSCLALGLKEKDILWTSPNSFVASANCGELCGAKLDLVDISLKDFNISIKMFKEKYCIVTGAAGFLGEYHCKSVLETSHSLIMIDIDKKNLIRK